MLSWYHNKFYGFPTTFDFCRIENLFVNISFCPVSWWRCSNFPFNWLTMSQIWLNNMNIIFPLIILYYSNHLRLQFEISKKSILMKQINNIYVTYREIYQNSICCTSTSIITEQKVLKVKKKFFFSLPSAMRLTLGKRILCRVPWIQHSAQPYFAECHELDNRQTLGP